MPTTDALNEAPLSPSASRRRSRDRTVVAIVGGGLLVAALAAGGGWMLRGATQPPMVAAANSQAQPMNTPPQAPDDRPMLEQAPPAPPSRVAEKPAPVRTEHAPVQQRQPAPVVAQAPVQTERRPVEVCQSCGTVESVRSIQRKGDANGVGAVAGGVLGAVLGNHVGGGNGRTAMTVLGAVGGGMAGNEVEKRMKAETVYEVRVRMDNGTTRTITQRSAPAQGSRVTVDGNGVHSM